MTASSRKSRVRIVPTVAGVRITIRKNSMRGLIAQVFFFGFWIIFALLLTAIVGAAAFFSWKALQNGSLEIIPVLFLVFSFFLWALVLRALMLQISGVEIIEVGNGKIVRKFHSLFKLKKEVLSLDPGFTAQFVEKKTGKGPNPELRSHTPSYIRLNLASGQHKVAFHIHQDEANEIITILKA